MARPASIRTANMELHLLRSFREVARERSFTAAAKNLVLTQPAVSQQVKALEDELGERLFDRTGRDVRLTAPGEVLLEATERVFALVDDATRRIREARTSDEGRVTLACGDTVTLYLLPPVLGEFRRRFPKAEVSVRNHASREVLDLVLSGAADLGVATAPPHLDAALEAAPLLDETFVLVLPPAHPLSTKASVSPSDVDGEPAVLIAKPAVTRSILDRGLREAGVRLVPVMESGNFEVVKAYVARGFGVSVLPAMAVTDADRGTLSVKPLPASFPKRRLVVIRRKDRFQTRLGRELTTLLAEHTRGLRRSKRSGA
jgi:DNA-binding transcriptional LysR family regulator